MAGGGSVMKKLGRWPTYGLLATLLVSGLLYGVVRVTTKSWCLRLGVGFDTGSIAFDFDRGFWRYCAGRDQDGSLLVVPFEAIRRNNGWQQAYGWWEEPDSKTPTGKEDRVKRDPLDSVVDGILAGSKKR
jgi:hypothetical protein